MPRRFLFDATKNATIAIAELFDFIWPTVVACWNMRSQVQGYVSLAGRVHEGELTQRFVAGSGIHGVATKKAFLTRSWEEHMDWFADVLLTSLFPIYEAWAKEIVVEVGSSKTSLATELQFPVSPPGTPKKDTNLGPFAVIAELTKTKSAFLEGTVTPRLRANQGYSLSQIDNLLVAYRYFKEGRNCRIHNGGQASPGAVKAFSAFSKVATEKDLNVNKLDPVIPFVAGQPIRISVRSVVGLGEIIMNILTTVDAELSKSITAEKILESLWRKGLPSVPHSLPDKAKRRHEKLNGLIKAKKLPEVASIIALDAWLQKLKLIQVIW